MAPQVPVNNGQKNEARLRVRDLAKSYGRNLVWSKVSFELRPGEVLGLVGPNGAGKTTLLLTLMGFLRSDCGNVQLNDQQVEGGWTPRGVGFIPDRPVFYDWQTPVQHLATSSSFAGQNAGATEIQVALTAVGLQNERLKPIRNFSRGMMQRLAWAQMIVTKPMVLLLDEPTSALDPLGVAALRDFVSRARDSGAGILFSSHTLSEVERICDRVLFLVRGKLSEMDQTQRNTCTRIRMRLHPASSRDLGCLQAVATEVSIAGDTVLFTLDGERSLNDVVRILSECGLQATSLENQSNSVEVALRSKLEEQ